MRAISTGNYTFQVNSRNTWTRCEIFSKLTKRHQNNVNNVVLASLLLTLNIFHTCSSVSIVNFEQVNAGWDIWDLRYLQCHCENTVISTNFPVLKFCGKAKFLYSFGRFAQNYAAVVRLRLGEIMVFFVVCWNGY